MPASTLSETLSIDVISDVVCPWCFIGKRKLEATLASLAAAEPGLEIRVRWHPFLLNLGLPAEGVPRSAYLAAKFGGAAQVEALQERVREAGAEAGIGFELGRIERQPNTLDAHRLIAWAQEQGDAGPMVEALFTAYFIDGRSLADRGSLADIAAAAGFERSAAAALLDSAALKDVVADEHEGSRDAGIQSVPFFIFNGRTAVSGAHEPPSLLKAIAAARVAPKPTFDPTPPGV